MSRLQNKQIYYICSALNDINQLILEEIPAESESEASDIFNKKFNISSFKILGPYLKKKVKPVEVSNNIQFTGEFKTAIYNNWKVNAFYLKEPENHALLVYLTSLSSDKEFPKGTTIIPIKDLRF